MEKRKTQPTRSRPRAGRGPRQIINGRVYRPRPLHIPPPDSPLWPEQYRGAKWKRFYGVLFEGKCQLCAYSFPPSKWRQGQDRCSGLPRLLLCTNRPDSPGEMQEVLPIETCRNFRPKRWTRRPSVPAEDRSRPPGDETDPSVRRIILSNGMVATVDAADYPRLSRYSWYASRHGRSVYACAKMRGKPVYMHHLVLRPTRGHVIDHIDRNGLNNRSSNLRETTLRQNLLNRRPAGGSSRFVGVSRFRDKWEAYIGYRGKHLRIGLYTDEVEAAKARDRKAYELHGDHAYLNFPEDYPRPRSGRSRKPRRTAKSNRGPSTKPRTG